MENNSSSVVWNNILHEINESFNHANNDEYTPSAEVLYEQQQFNVGLEPKYLNIELDAVEDFYGKPISNTLLLAKFIDDLNYKYGLSTDIDWQHSAESTINDGYIVRLNCTENDALTILKIIYDDNASLLDAIDVHLVDCDVDEFKKFVKSALN